MRNFKNNKIWNWFSGKVSIRKKLIISFGILVSIPIIVLGFYAFFQSKNNLEIQTSVTMDNNLSRLVMEMDARFQRETDFTKYLAYNLNFRRALENHPGNNVEIAQTLNHTVEPIFWYFLTSDTYMKEINVYTPYVEHPIGSFLKPDAQYRGEEWYKAHEKNFNTVWSYEEGRLFATRSILDTATTSKALGVFRTEFFLNTMLEPMNSMDYLDNGIIITDKEGNIVYRKESTSQKVDGAVFHRIFPQEGKTEGKNEGYLLKTGVISQCGWNVYYYIDKNRISEQLVPIIGSTLCMVGLCILLVILFMGLLSGTLSKRILLLRETAEEIAGGKLDTPIFTEDTDEIGIVANSLATMTQQLNEMINKVYKMEIEKKAIELRALQAMINPHFLYNSLSAIKWKAIKEGNDGISDITGLLAKFYRTSLNNGNQITIVRNELENIKAYVEIQKLTHENSFEAEYDLEEEGMDHEMLNFLLQPIVENAIKHGIDYREDGEGEKGVIRIAFREQGDYIFFTVRNNGPKVELKELEAVIDRPGKGYGIFNIKERIALYYGDGCGLFASVTPEGETCFTVKINKNVSH